MFALTLAAIMSPPATVPFTYFDNRMMIECKIDGKGPFHMIVDTGDPVMTITPETARRLGLTVRRAGTVTGAGNHAVENGDARLATLAIGSLSLANVDAGVIDLSQIRSAFHFPQLDGIVGYEVLKRYATFVDVDAGTLSFDTTMPPVPANATSTPFAGVLPEIAVIIDGIATTAIVDTGDRSSLTLFTPFAKRHAFYGRYPSQQNIVTGYGLGGPVYADVFTLPGLDVFGFHLTRVVTRASRQSAGVFASGADGGSIGTGILKRFNIVYDYPHHTIVAWPSKYFAASDAFVPPGASGGRTENSQHAAPDSALIGEVYALLRTTFYRPISGRAIRAGADAAILEYARKQGARDPRIALGSSKGGSQSLILADAARASNAYRLDPQATSYAAVCGMAASTRDRWTEFFTPQEWASFDAPLDPKAIFGIGVLLDVDPATHYARSFYVIPGGPADDAGIASGDLITTVDGKSTRGMAQPQVSKLLRGPPDTPVRLATKAHDGIQREVSLTRSSVRPPTVIVKLLPNKVGYILVGIFAQPTAGEFTAALERLRRDGARALVIDLRDDGGGYISAAISIASHFFSSASIVTTLDRDGVAITDASNDEEPQITIPVAVLVNGFTASASEILAGALQDNHAAILIGTRTFGKGVAQTITRLPNGAAIKITTARYLTPANRDLNGAGLQPDVVVPPTKGAALGDPSSDGALQSALVYLKRQVALRDSATSG